MRGLGEPELYQERVDDSHSLRNLVEPPEHLIYLGHTAAGTARCVVLFGDLMFALPVDASSSYSMPQTAWRLDPRLPNPTDQAP